jgi:hypothetical protein
LFGGRLFQQAVGIPIGTNSAPLVSNRGKLVTSVLNVRLLKWATNNYILTDAQFGFRNCYSTTDDVFSL